MKTLRVWPLPSKKEEELRGLIIHLFCLKFLNLLGYLSIEDICKVCLSEITAASFYIFGTGEVCKNCFEKHNHSQNMLAITVLFKAKQISQSLLKVFSEQKPEAYNTTDMGTEYGEIVDLSAKYLSTL